MNRAPINRAPAHFHIPARQPLARSPNRATVAVVKRLMSIGPEILPFADAGTVELPMGRLLRLSLFQITVGMAAVLLIGTLNRVMIVELAVPAWIVAVMLALPLLFAPFRTLVGFRSDTHRSVLGWRRVPFIWMGTMLQFGGLAIMPFALLILSGDTTGPIIIGEVAAALAFLMVGAGLHTVQTVGLALATDLAPAHARPRVVALLCAMLLLGMAVSALAFGALLAHFSEIRLIQVVQGCGSRHHGAERNRAVEAGSAQLRSEAERSRGPSFVAPGSPSLLWAARVAVWSPRRSAPPASACRTFCSNPMAARFSICRWGRPPRSPRCWRSAAALVSTSPRAG